MNTLRRLVRVFAIGIAVVFSLLVFPGSLSFSVLFWVIGGLFALKCSNARVTAACFVFAVALACLKGPFTPALAGLVGAGLVAALLVNVRMSRPKVWTLATLVVLAAAVFSVDRYVAANTSRRTENKSNGVACVGDSLTSGLPSMGGYPKELASLMPNVVFDFGREGITADEAIPFLDEITASRPSFVIIELGGHDFLKKQSRSSTKQDLAKIIEHCQAVDAHVLLCEIPRGFIFDPYFGVERELAREYDLDLVADSVIRNLVLFSPHAPPGLWLPKTLHYSDDGLHPNAAGNRMLARHLARRLGN